MSWTDERVKLLSKLWQEGLSASQVAAELGGGVTRNAVIGKVHRLGLAAREKTHSPVRKKPHQKGQSERGFGTRQPTLVQGNTVIKLQGGALAALKPRFDAVVIPISEQVSFVDLRENMCRWPIGDPTASEFRFCGNKTGDDNCPYCQGHARLAYQPAYERRAMRKLAKSA